MKVVYRVIVVAVALLAAFGAIYLGGSALKATLAGLAMIVGVYVGLRHPIWLLWLLAFVAGMFPAGYLPGVHVPMVFSFAMGSLLATIIHPWEVTGFSTLERWVLALVGVSFVSLVASGFNLIAIMEYVKWTTATLLIIVLLRLPRDQLRRFGQVYVVSATAASLLAIGIVFGDSGGRVLKALSILGYGVKDNNFFVYTESGAVARLAGTFLEPNSAGIAILVAALICAVVFDGWRRVACGAILLLALALTLSRASLFAVVVGVVLMLVFASLSARQRMAIVGVFFLGFCVAIAVPKIRNRIFSSFGSQDAGSNARLDALKDFPGYMGGKWVFGRGWGLIEFKDPSKSIATNFVANAPLLATYRGGVIVATVFVLTFLYASYLAYQCLRTTHWNLAFYGGGFIGFFFLTMQLDIGTVTIPATVAALSLLVTFLKYTHELAMDLDDVGRGRPGPVPPPLPRPAPRTPVVDIVPPRVPAHARAQ